MRGIIISTLIVATCGYKMNPQNIHSHPPLYGRDQYGDDVPAPEKVTPPRSYDNLPDGYEEYGHLEVEDNYQEYLPQPFSSDSDPEYQQYWHQDENKVIYPSMALSNGYIPREVMHFRETFKVLRKRYPYLPLFAKEDFMVNGEYPEYGNETYGGREGKFFLPFPFALPPMFMPLFAGGGGGEATTVSLTDHCDLVCGNNNGLCMDCGQCMAEGGQSIGTNCPTDPGFCCCKKEFTTNANTDSVISFFTSPGFPNPMRSSDSFTLSVTIEPQMDQLLIEFLTFEMAGGPSGCSGIEYLEVMTSNYAGGVLGPDNSRFCGMNTDQHLYLDVKPGDIVILKAVFAGLNFNWDDVNPTEKNKKNYHYRSADSRFQLKLTQIVALENIVQPDATPNCILHKLRAPNHCTQYYNELRGTFMNFNYDGRTCMPPNLNYRVCFAHPENYCGISMSALEFDIPTTSVKCMSGYKQVDGQDLCCAGESSRTGDLYAGHTQKYLGLDGTGDGSTKGVSYVNNQERYFFCGTNFGKTNFVVSEARGPMVAQVFSGPTPCTKCEGYEDHGVGFKIRYNINVGTC